MVLMVKSLTKLHLKKIFGKILSKFFGAKILKDAAGELQKAYMRKGVYSDISGLGAKMVWESCLSHPHFFDEVLSGHV